MIMMRPSQRLVGYALVVLYWCWILTCQASVSSAFVSQQCGQQRIRKPQPKCYEISPLTTLSSGSSYNSRHNSDRPRQLRLSTRLDTANRRIKSWEERIAELKEYKEKYGTVNVPSGCKESPELSRYVRTLRYKKSRVSEDKRNQLNELGFTWDDADVEKRDQQWENMFETLKEYKSLNGHCCVPQIYPGNEKLGKWVSLQRQLYCKGVIRHDREELLNSIGFVWRLRDRADGPTKKQAQQWFAKYEELVKFYKHHGHFAVPRKGPAKSLNHWLFDQRKLYNKKLLRQERIDLLEKIDFPWNCDDIIDSKWHDQYNLFKEYCLTRGGTSNDNVVMGPTTQIWVRNQRLQNEKGVLDPERKALLDKIGFEWFPIISIDPDIMSERDRRWHQKYQQLIQFHEENGHFKLNRRHNNNEIRLLAYWVSVQRERYRNGKLEPEREKLLSEIGFPWNPRNLPMK